MQTAQSVHHQERTSRSHKRSYKGAGRVNSDFFAFGQPILAPADGKVVQVVDGVPDNTPGAVDVYFRLGNMVVLDLGRGEYAYLCHLQQGSPSVRVGERVRRGQVVARCGNSGNSTEPHLHFQLADGPQITPWFTGTLLLIIVYYLGGRAMLVDAASPLCD
mgnify:CR=1 FL=1